MSLNLSDLKNAVLMRLYPDGFAQTRRTRTPIIRRDTGAAAATYYPNMGFIAASPEASGADLRHEETHRVLEPVLSDLLKARPADQGAAAVAEALKRRYPGLYSGTAEEGYAEGMAYPVNFGYAPGLAADELEPKLVQPVLRSLRQMGRADIARQYESLRK